jgi:hypothetical protein
MSIVISAINTDMAEVIWPTMRPFIEMAIGKSNGELDIEETYQKIMINELLPLAVMEKETGKLLAVVTLERRTFESGKAVLNIMTAGGEEVDQWFEEVLDIAEKLAKEQGCEDVYIIGRPGWKRKLNHLGYGVVHTVLSKKVGE